MGGRNEDASRPPVPMVHTEAAVLLRGQNLNRHTKAACNMRPPTWCFVSIVGDRLVTTTGSLCGSAEQEVRLVQERVLQRPRVPKKHWGAGGHNET